MLKVLVSKHESFDEETNEFIVRGDFVLELEHSLASLSKWESKHEKPFLGSEQKTVEETIDYIKMMSLTGEIDDKVMQLLSTENLNEVNTYIAAKMTATTFKQLNQRPSREIITAEIIYYWLVTLQIPFECQYWHLNRLLTLVQVINEKNKPQKKVGRQTAAQQQRELNQRRREQLGTRG